ncbi:GBS Bsp-like repeat-containing protein [Acetobacterium bakii]|uniref:MurNAc-LAA domain-containing protein n=1 Tax=Acetobacterium bakii TaxID=52689 RepID=A0A0L6U3I8_9FIRM|nr:GBS Bsp-like repeat-containing protein [Acetobacterium bakii]KNZ43086.1 hypothetical protein AKG39_02715 [Acetobacterium bakii]
MESIKNKRKFALLGAILLFMCLVLFSYESLSVEAAGTMVVVNPGHMDGVDPGAVNSSNGIREVDLNNAVAIKTVATLRANGYNAMLSHPIPGNPGLPTLLATKPNYDVYSKTICETANARGADLLLSIHHNSGGNASGYELYWSSYHPSVDNDGIYQAFGLWSDGSSADLDISPSAIALKSKELAYSLNENFKSLGYVPTRNKVVERDDSITRRTSMPSVLIEAGFVSNNAESVRMANDANQQKMADQILVTVNGLFGSQLGPMTATGVTASASGSKITLTVKGITAPNGIKQIQFPVWSETGGQDDIKWYTASAQSDGSYSVTIDTKDHNNEIGVYSVHCYGTDNANNLTMLGNTTVVVTKPMTATNLAASVSGTKITATVKGITAPNGIKQIQVPVWSELNGQDDLKWYIASAQSDGSYSVTIDTKDHNYNTGVYNVHCYGIDNSDYMVELGVTTATITTTTANMTATSLTASASGTKITATVKGITAPNGIKQIQVPVWSELNGQDDLKWYTASAQSDGSYSVTIDTKDHNNDTGVYSVHCYGTDNANKLTMLGNTTVTMTASMSATSLTASVSGSTITATVKGISAPNGIRQILVPVWSELNGQDDLKWHLASRQSDGSYSVTIDTKDHNNDMGVYNIHCYGTDNADKMVILGEATASITTTTTANMTAASLEATVSGSEITATIKGIAAPNGIKEILIPLWSETNGQDDLKWYTATAQSDGSYSVTADIKDHNYDGGTYHVHGYGTDNNNKMTILGETAINVSTSPMTAEDIAASVAENIITVTIDGITAPNGISSILVPTWSDLNGQDDIKWYTAAKQSDGSYKMVIDAKNHNGNSGSYSIHIYGVEANGRNVFLGNTSVNVRYIETPIMGGTTVTASELVAYYKGTGSVYPQSYIDKGVNLETFVDLYIQESNEEGVRAEVAFAQAMLETGNLQFGGDVKVGQFNFAGLGATGGVPGFDFAAKYGDNATGLQMGIRGHVQHLKCYACSEPLYQTKVDPRWNDTLRLRAISVEELAGTWAADTNYAAKVKTIMNRF